MSDYDAIIIGSGPNGLAAAVTLARAGAKVAVFEGQEAPGGATRSGEMTLSGFVHDVGSSIHPMALCSPFMTEIADELAIDWVQPEIDAAHPIDDGTAGIFCKSIDETVAHMTPRDAKAYRRLLEGPVGNAEKLFGDLMGPLGIPKHPIAAGLFGVRTISPALGLARMQFESETTRAMFAGHAAHSVMPLDRPLTTSAIALMLMIAGHHKGWVFPRGGAGKISEALAAYLGRLGGEIHCNHRVETLDALPKANAYLFDTAPKNLARIAGARLPLNYRKKLNAYRHGPGIFKIDYALSEPVPWTNAETRRATTVHLGGTLDEIAIGEREVFYGRHSENPFVLSAQHTVADPSRAPEGKHTFWAYCHVPNGSTRDMTEIIENQIERFAPGFRDTILEKATATTAELEAFNPNLIGGDIVGGVTDWRQLFARPVNLFAPYSTPAADIFICSASTPPGGGVHGMSGYHAAQRVLRDRLAR